MNQTEINKDLEILSNEFKKSISNHFNDKGIDVQLNTLDFSIVKSINQKDNIKVLEISKNESNIKVFTTQCYVNKQGQTVCKTR